MRTGKSLFYIVIISFNLLACNALAESSVWKVSKGESYFYLGGTIHLLKADDHPLPAAFNTAFKDAGTVFFETDLDTSQSPEFQSKLMAAMTFSDDRTLTSELKPETFQQLEAFLISRQIPIANFAKFQPWGVSLIAAMLEYQRLGMLPQYGVDAHFNKLARSENKKIMSLETLEQQLSFIISMAKVDPNTAIEYTLRDLEHLPEFIQSMKESWRSGDMEAFSKNAFITQMEIEFPEMYNTLVTTRNDAWMEQLPALIEDNNIEFVMVGAMHLIGTKGLLNQLKAQGFMLEQL